jgi:hypothetical protein
MMPDLIGVAGVAEYRAFRKVMKALLFNEKFNAAGFQA